MAKLARILGVSSLFAACATPGLPNDADGPTKARVHIDELTSSGEVPGLQYQVVGADGVLFHAAAGVQDAASGHAMQETTLQMAYSTTKVLTAVAVMQLVQSGRLDLDSPLSRYHADHPYGDEVTIRHLLAQISGVPDPLPLDWFVVAGQPFDRTQKLHAVLADNPRLRQRPGEKYGYSNLSYWLLEKAVEQASQQDFAVYVADHILQPLGISPAAANFTGEGPVARGHSPRLNPITLVLTLMTPAAYWDGTNGGWRRNAHVLPFGRGYGGLFTTAGALATVLRDLLRAHPVLMAPATRDQLFEPQHTRNGDPLAMTLGWVIGDVDGQRYFGKQGGGLGFHGNVRVYPDRGLATVLLANRTEISAGPIDARSDALDAIFLQTPTP